MSVSPQKRLEFHTFQWWKLEYYKLMFFRIGHRKHPHTTVLCIGPLRIFVYRPGRS